MKGIVLGDSSAAMAISQRQGAGKLRHINIGMLWIQEKSRSKELTFEKVKSDHNPADLMTKHTTEVRSRYLCEKLGLYERDGRAASGLQVQGKGVKGSEAKAV